MFLTDAGKSSMILLFVVSPTIVPNSRRQFEGEQAQEFSIKCSAVGKPDPKYIFYKVRQLAVVCWF